MRASSCCSPRRSQTLTNSPHHNPPAYQTLSLPHSFTTFSPNSFRTSRLKMNPNDTFITPEQSRTPPHPFLNPPTQIHRLPTPRARLINHRPLHPRKPPRRPPQNPRHPPLNQPHVLLMIHLHRPNHPRTDIPTRHHLHPAPLNLPFPLSSRLPHIPKIRIQKLPATLQHPPHLTQKPPHIRITMRSLHVHHHTSNTPSENPNPIASPTENSHPTPRMRPSDKTQSPANSDPPHAITPGPKYRFTYEAPPPTPPTTHLQAPPARPTPAPIHHARPIESHTRPVPLILPLPNKIPRPRLTHIPIIQKRNPLRPQQPRHHRIPRPPKNIHPNLTQSLHPNHPVKTHRYQGHVCTHQRLRRRARFPATKSLHTSKPRRAIKKLTPGATG